MKKMQENHKKAMKNGGFSLVELIIVVAILAVLTALLAPQYFQYIERSRKAVDVNTAAEILQAVKVAAIDPDNDAEGNFSVTWNTASNDTVVVAATGTGTGALAATSVTKMQTAINAVVGGDTPAHKSNFAKTQNFVINVVYTAGTGFNFSPDAVWGPALAG